MSTTPSGSVTILVGKGRESIHLPELAVKFRRELNPFLSEHDRASVIRLLGFSSGIADRINVERLIRLIGHLKSASLWLHPEQFGGGRKAEAGAAMRLFTRALDLEDAILERLLKVYSDVDREFGPSRVFDSFFPFFGPLLDARSQLVVFDESLISHLERFFLSQKGWETIEAFEGETWAPKNLDASLAEGNKLLWLPIWGSISWSYDQEGTLHRETRPLSVPDRWAWAPRLEIEGPNNPFFTIRQALFERLRTSRHLILMNYLADDLSLAAPLRWMLARQPALTLWAICANQQEFEHLRKTLGLIDHPSVVPIIQNRKGVDLGRQDHDAVNQIISGLANAPSYTVSTGVPYLQPIQPPLLAAMTGDVPLSKETETTLNEDVILEPPTLEPPSSSKREEKPKVAPPPVREPAQVPEAPKVQFKRPAPPPTKMAGPQVTDSLSTAKNANAGKAPLSAPQPPEPEPLLLDPEPSLQEAIREAEKSTLNYPEPDKNASEETVTYAEPETDVDPARERPLDQFSRLRTTTDDVMIIGPDDRIASKEPVAKAPKQRIFGRFPDADVDLSGLLSEPDEAPAATKTEPAQAPALPELPPLKASSSPPPPPPPVQESPTEPVPLVRETPPVETPRQTSEVPHVPNISQSEVQRQLLIIRQARLDNPDSLRKLAAALRHPHPQVMLNASAKISLWRYLPAFSIMVEALSREHSYWWANGDYLHESERMAIYQFLLQGITKKDCPFVPQVLSLISNSGFGDFGVKLLEAHPVHPRDVTEALTGLRDEALFALLIKKVEDRGYGYRPHLIGVLGQWGRGEAIPPLSRMLTDPDSKVREAAAKGLGMLIPDIRQADILVKAMSTDASREVREAAKEALRRIEAKDAYARKRG